MSQKLRSRLIALAAKRWLEPINCQRKGRSRVWFSDQGFWRVWVAFEPHSSATGTYLTVAAQWFWHPPLFEGFAASVGGRLGDIGFVDFEDEGQFTQETERLAIRAVEEVVELRRRFQSVPAIAGFFQSASPRPYRWSLGYHGWARYDAAVAFGLIGDIRRSEQHFHEILAEPAYDYDWIQKQRATAEHLLSCLPDHAAFRAAVAELIQACRTLQKLPPVPDCFRGALD